jgi:5-methylcytosine-specific restriction endonuclease McrA
MPQTTLTPEERLARKRASKRRSNAKNREKNNADARLRRARDPEKHRDAVRKSKLKHPETAPRATKRWRAANPDKVKAQKHRSQARHSKRWYAQRRARTAHMRALLNAIERAKRAANPEPYRMHGRRNYQRHKAAFIARAMRWNAAHPLIFLAIKSVWRAANPAKVRAAGRRYRQRHPERKAFDEANRRARKAAAQRQDVTPEQRAMVIAAAHGVCPYCPHYNPTCKACRTGTHKLTIDHVTALKNEGEHTLWNLVACCVSCNSKKGTRPNPIPVQPLLL